MSSSCYQDFQYLLRLSNNIIERKQDNIGPICFWLLKLKANLSSMECWRQYKQSKHSQNFVFLFSIDEKCDNMRYSDLPRGTPTTILINLCISLIVLLVVTSVAEYKANTRLGCRLSNIFRYYLILVSLLWNGTEAHNMYRMLVKVFNVDSSHFAMRAAFVSYCE